jgi:ABC-2 type transport system ATP-binding protein
MRTARMLLATALLLLTAAVPAHAVETKLTPVKIPATQPDDAGNPVALDGGVVYPDSGCPCPGVIINHGFLGKWQDSNGITQALAREGYVVLRYSSRGFGETPGEVDLMGPKERQDLLDAVHWLNDPANPVVGGMVMHNRIGQFGGSYGGAHAWALAASGDPAVRTVIPTATWTDIYDALIPNGVMLLAYANGFYASGFGPTGGLINGGPPGTDDNYSKNIHRWMAEANSGVGTADMKAGLAERSVYTQYDKVKIPVFIVQGVNDGLFSVNQALDAYKALTARDVEARLYFGGIGHPPSESNLDGKEATYIGQQALAWFDHHLKGVKNGIDKAPPIEFSRADYFKNRWDGTTRSAKRYPFGDGRRVHLCTTGPNGGTLSDKPCPGAQPAVAVNGTTAASGYNAEPVTAGAAEELDNGLDAITQGRRPDTSTAPTVLSYETGALDAPLELAGVPEFRLQVAAADVLPAGLEGGAAAFQLDPKLYDVGSDGKAKLLTRGAFAEELDAVGLDGLSTVANHLVRFEAFGLSNRIPAGHRLRITLQTSDLPFLRPTANPFAAVVFAGSAVDLPTTEDLKTSATSTRAKVRRWARVRR